MSESLSRVACGCMIWLVAAIVGIVVSFGPAYVSASVCAQLYPEVWSMEIAQDDTGRSPESLLSKVEFGQVGKLRNLDERLVVGTAPDGKPALEMRVWDGENRIISFHSAALAEMRLNRACLSAEIYYNEDFDVARAGTKIGVGLWGGDGSEGRRDSGGWPPELQNGWSVRILNNRRGLRPYAYHLERDGKRRAQKRCEPYGCLWGEPVEPVSKLPKGRWVPLDLEIVLNDIDERNGRLRFWVDGKISAEKDGLVFRRDEDWYVNGLKFTDMWGGSTNNPKNFSPKEQRHWYANYRIFGES